MARAISIDPGSITGIAILHETGLFVTMSLPTQDGAVAPVLELIIEQRPKVVIIERFITRGMISRFGLETIELVGAVKALHYLSEKLDSESLYCGLEAFELVRRAPGQRKVKVPEATRIMRQQRLELGIKFTDHEVAALAHLLGWMKENGIDRRTSDTGALPGTSV